jgi:hypothetical protein
LTTFPDRRCTPSRKQGQPIEDRDGSLWVQATAALFHLRGSVFRGFKEILEGKHDEVPEGNFYMKGHIEEIKQS